MDLKIINQDLCNNCGVCCKELGTPPFLQFEILKLPKELIAEVQEKGFQNERLGMPCYWWNPDTKQCNQHEHRPQICRDFDAGGESCLLFRSHHGINYV